MSEIPPAATSLWARAVADRDFCEALIVDPLRALADTPGVTANPDQVRRLEAMSLSERDTMVRDLVRDVTARRAREQWGDRVWSPEHDTEFDVMFQAQDASLPPEAKRQDDDDDRDEDAFVS